MDEQNGITRPIAMHFDEKDGKIREDEISRVVEDAQRQYFRQALQSYYRNWRFLGSVAAASFLAQGLYLGIHSISARCNIPASNKNHRIRSTCQHVKFHLCGYWTKSELHAHPDR